MLSIQENDPRIESIDEVTGEAVIRIEGLPHIAYGQPNLRGGYTFRIF